MTIALNEPTGAMSPVGATKWETAGKGEPAERHISSRDVLEYPLPHTYDPKQAPCGSYAATVLHFVERPICDESILMNGSGSSPRSLLFADTVYDCLWDHEANVTDTARNYSKHFPIFAQAEIRHRWNWNRAKLTGGGAWALTQS